MQVAALFGYKAAITIVDKDPTGSIVFDNLRNYDAPEGCLSECVTIRPETCTSDMVLPEPGMLCLFVNDFHLPYVPVKKVKHGLAQYCVYGLAPFGENGGALLTDESFARAQSAELDARLEEAGKPPIISTERMLDTPDLPTCIYVEISGGFSTRLNASSPVYGLATREDGPIYMYDTDKVHSATDHADLMCLFPTTKPRCAAFDGVLKSRRQHNIYCVEEEVAQSCMELVYMHKCKDGEYCGQSETTKNLLKCCDRADNNPGSGCLRRRRLGEMMDMALVTDVEGAEACAEHCMRRANGPSALPLDKACVAWRLDEEGECKVSTKCVYEEQADSMLLEKKLWNTFDGVDFYKGAVGPHPTLKRVEVCIPVNHINDHPGELTCDCVSPHDPCLADGECVEEPECDDDHGSDHGDGYGSDYGSHI